MYINCIISYRHPFGQPYIYLKGDPTSYVLAASCIAQFSRYFNVKKRLLTLFYPPKSNDVITTSKASDNCTCSEEFELHHFRQQMDSLQREVCMPRKLSSGNRSNANIWSAARRCSAYQRGNLENMCHLLVFPFIVLHHWYNAKLVYFRISVLV